MYCYFCDRKLENETVKVLTSKKVTNGIIEYENEEEEGDLIMCQICFNLCKELIDDIQDWNQ